MKEENGAFTALYNDKRLRRFVRQRVRHTAGERYREEVEMLTWERAWLTLKTHPEQILRPPWFWRTCKTCAIDVWRHEQRYIRVEAFSLNHGNPYRDVVEHVDSTWSATNEDTNFLLVTPEEQEPEILIQVKEKQEEDRLLLKRLFAAASLSPFEMRVLLLHASGQRPVAIAKQIGCDLRAVYDAYRNAMARLRRRARALSIERAG